MATGTNTGRKLLGSDNADVQFGGGNADLLNGLAGNDSMYGGSGNDNMSGGLGDDLMFGESGRGGRVDLTKLAVAGEAVQGTVTFNSESAGYKNALGVYKIAADGTIHSVDILWANASLKGSDGDLIANQSSVNLALNPGERLGFFIVPDGYSQKNMAKLLSDEKGSFRFVDAKGNPGNVNGGTELKLVHVSEKGTQTVVQSTYGTSIFHSVDDGTKGLNGDKLNHAVATVDTAAGTIKIGFEDLKGGGDKDYDDSVFTLKMGAVNSALVSKLAVSKVVSPHDDVMSGDDGNDTMFGMSGNDTMDGGTGDDKMWGNSGDDVMSGGDGNDQMSGGAGNDTLADGDGDDTVNGNSGDDTFVAGEGDDSYTGGSGFDTLDFSSAKNGVEVSLHAHTASGMGNDKMSGVEGVVGSSFADKLTGDKAANSLDGGAGDDVLRGMGGADVLTGGEGSDRFVWLAKDVMLDGKHLGADTITDFSTEDVLDLRGVLKGQKWGSIDEVVTVKDDGQNAHVFAQIGNQWAEVAVLENFHGMTAAEMLHAGMLLA